MIVLKSVLHGNVYYKNKESINDGFSMYKEMGFTIYWTQIQPVSQEVWNTFEHRALNLVKRRRTGPIELENKYTRPAQKNILSFKGTPEKSGELFSVSKDSERARGFCKTGRNPYTFDVFVCLILMFDLGMLKGFRSDDMNEQYPEALDYVKNNYALKRSYDKLKIMGRYENNEGKNLTHSPSPVSQHPRKQTYKKKTKTTKPKAVTRSRHS